MYSRYLYSFQGRKRRRKDRGLWATLAERNSMETQNTIGIAGVGKMGEALVRGLIVGRVVPASRILVSDAIPARAKEIAAKHGVRSLETVADLARESDILVLAAKPKDMPSLVTGIAAHVKRDALVITLAAGVRTAFVEKSLNGRGRVVRIMPNLACAVGEGATAFALGMVATPNGTTEAGWAVMEKRGVPHAISDAIVAASKRAAELAAEVAKAHG